MTTTLTSESTKPLTAEPTQSKTAPLRTGKNQTNPSPRGYPRTYAPGVFLCPQKPLRSPKNPPVDNHPRTTHKPLERHTEPLRGKQFPEPRARARGGSVPFACDFFLFFGFWYIEYAIVLVMTVSYVTELRNVDWELYLLYSEGLVKPERERFLWAEVDRLEGLIALSDG